MPSSKLKKKYRRRRILVLVILILLIISVCAVIDLVQRDDEFKLVSGEKTPALSEVTAKASDSRPVTPAASVKTKAPQAASPGNAGKTQKFDIQLFFPDEYYSNLKKVPVTLSYQSATDTSSINKIKAVIECLAGGVKAEGYRTAIPKDTSVIGVKIAGKSVSLNLSKEFVQNQSEGSLAVRLTLGQIVLSCGELGFDQVSIIVDGKTVELYPGDIDLSVPLNKADYLNLIF